MKKRLAIALVFALVASVFITGVASASDSQPVGSASGGNIGCDAVVSLALSGALRPYLLDTLAENFGISSDDLEIRLANGETYYAIALSEDISSGSIVSLVQAALEKALSLASMDGAITSAEGEQMQWYASCEGYGPNPPKGPTFGQPPQGSGGGQPMNGPGNGQPGQTPGSGQPGPTGQPGGAPGQGGNPGGGNPGGAGGRTGGGPGGGPGRPGGPG